MIYVVVHHEYDDATPVAAFTDKAAAEAYAALYNRADTGGGADIVELRLDHTPERKQTLYWRATVKFSTGEVTPGTRGHRQRRDDKPDTAPRWHWNDLPHDEEDFYVPKYFTRYVDDEQVVHSHVGQEKAIEIAHARRAEFLKMVQDGKAAREAGRRASRGWLVFACPEEKKRREDSLKG